MKIHDGYIFTRGKTPITKKTKDQTWRDVMVDHVDDGIDHAGILNSDVGFIDTDTYEDSCALLEWLKTLPYKPPVLQTDKGYHAYFLIPKGYDKDLNGYITPIGIRIDWRVGSNHCGLDCLCVNGKQRQWLHDGELHELPHTMLPIYKTDNGLVGLKEGGRDVALFNHFNQLIKCGMPLDEFRAYGELINKFILAKPYEDMYKFYQEKQYTRLIEKLENTNKRLQLADYVNLVTDEFTFNYIDNALYYYVDGIYVSDTSKIEHYLTQIDGNITESKRKEVIKTITLQAMNNYIPRAQWYYVPFANGYIDIRDTTLHPYHTDIVFTKKLPINWNTNANSNILNTLMNNIKEGHDEVEIALYEMVGYSLLDTCKLNRAFIMIGDGSNGKSVFMTMLKELYGEDGFSPLSLTQCTEKFCTHMLYNKFANLGEDISGIYKRETDVFKCLTDGNTIKAEQKGKDPILFNATTTLIFCANDIPKLGNGADKKAIMRRLQIIPFRANFDKAGFKKDLTMADKVKQPEVLESLAVRSIMAIRNVMLNGLDLITVESDERTEYEEMLSPLESIIRTVGVNGTAKEVYTRYKTECYEMGLTPFGLFQFYKEMRKIGYTKVQTRIEGERCYMFVSQN